MTNNILVVGEGRADGLKKVSLELITAAKGLSQPLGSSVEAVVVGFGVADWAAVLSRTGVARVHVVDKPELAQFAPESLTAALAQVINNVQPAVVLFGATGWGKELSARTAAKLDWGLATDCTAIRIEDGKLVMERPIYAGKAIAHVRAKTMPAMASLRPNIIPPAEQNEDPCPIENVEVTLPEPSARVIEAASAERSKVDLSEAKVVVSGGRGVKGPEGFEPVRELAETLGGALGASRAAVDAGWIDYTHQVGQTGKTVSPNLYIAAGISGAIQHLAGMSSSKVIVAVNKDPDAPIFKVADYGIVGDLFQVLPAVNAELKKLREQG